MFAANDDPDIGFVWEWFEYQLALLDQSRDDVSGLLLSVGTKPRPHEARFLGLTGAEVDGFFHAQRDQLKLLTMLELLATTEAILRIDFSARVAATKADPLSSRYLKLVTLRGSRIRLAADLLKAMKAEVAEPGAVSAFLGVLNLRDWLAHGRYWRPDLGRNYAPNDVFDICRDLIDLMPPL